MLQAFFFLFLKRPGLKIKEIVNINFLIIVLMKIRLLIFLVFNQYGLASVE